MNQKLHRNLVCPLSFFQKTFYWSLVIARFLGEKKERKVRNELKYLIHELRYIKYIYRNIEDLKTKVLSLAVVIWLLTRGKL